jgi:hypothetical protein
LCVGKCRGRERELGGGNSLIESDGILIPVYKENSIYEKRSSCQHFISFKKKNIINLSFESKK